MTTPPTNISLGFMPAFFHKHTGVTYGEAYYWDPEYRADVERIEGRFLYEILGDVGVGNPSPQPSTNLFIQPIDLMTATLGASLRYPDDATLETYGQPWAGRDAGEIAAIDAREAAANPLIDAVVRQYHAMTRLYGDAADVFGLKGGVLNAHTPFTTAHQLCGEELFCLMLEDPAAARRIFAKVWEIYRAIFTRLCEELRVPLPDRLYAGDCSASLLSAATYRATVLPVNQEIALTFREAAYHSCGASTHLLADFAALERVVSIELGAGTDLSAAVRALPGVAMRPLVDPLVLLNGNEDDVADLTNTLLAATAAAPATTLCAWSFDRETPIANVTAMYHAQQAWTRDTE